jgi:hypothetical protein
METRTKVHPCVHVQEVGLILPRTSSDLDLACNDYGTYPLKGKKRSAITFAPLPPDSRSQPSILSEAKVACVSDGAGNTRNKHGSHPTTVQYSGRQARWTTVALCQH